MFIHDNTYKFPELNVENTSSGRFYITPSGNRYPSVTTILGATSDNTWLEEWKKRVGEKEANRISKQATLRGEAVHTIIEKYLSNDQDYLKKQMSPNVKSFNKIKEILDKNINKIYNLEVPLYSDFLRSAGRVDCFAQWNQKNSIIDFKTSKKEKTKEDIKNYFLQESSYAYMIYERTGTPISQIVTIITVDDLPSGQIFVEKTKDYLDEFISRRNSLSF